MAKTRHATVGTEPGPGLGAQQGLPGRLPVTCSVGKLCSCPHKPGVPLGTQPFTYTPSTQPPEPGVQQLCYIKALLLFSPSSNFFLRIF